MANGINNLGQIVGNGTVAGDNLDHALTWTVDEGGGIPCEDLLSFPVRCKRYWRRRRPQIAGPAYPTRATSANRSS
jgi:hypothetical protein